MIINFSNSRVKRILTCLIEGALKAANPENAIRNVLQLKGQVLHVGSQQYHLSKYQRVVCIGAGKASGSMALAVEHVLGSRLDSGIVVVKEGYGCQTRTIQVLQAGHPVPDRRSEQAATNILKFVRTLTRHDLLLVAISGGASSLLVSPASSLSLSDKKKVTRLLLSSGARIEEVNVVRKHLSAIKGGRLAEACSATIVGLLLSDVMGNDVSSIGSGPVVADPSTYEEAWRTLESYGLWKRIPQSVRRHLQAGMRGKIPETPKPGSRIFRRTYQNIVGDTCLAVEGLDKQAEAMGIPSLILTTSLTGEAREAGKFVGAAAREIHFFGRPISPPACLIWGGELTVTVRGTGQGGRAQEFALSAAEEIAGLPNVYVAGFGTDGTDGATDVAGAVVDGRTLSRAKACGMDTASVLHQNDSLAFFKKVGGHIVPGPTGTNVNDIYLVLVL